MLCKCAPPSSSCCHRGGACDHQASRAFIHESFRSSTTTITATSSSSGIAINNVHAGMFECWAVANRRLLRVQRYVTHGHLCMSPTQWLVNADTHVLGTASTHHMTVDACTPARSQERARLSRKAAVPEPRSLGHTPVTASPLSCARRLERHRSHVRMRMVCVVSAGP
jgi:hypothetical protein